MKSNLKWLLAIIIVLAIVIYLFSSSGMTKISTDYIQAYADETLYENAIKKANENQIVLDKIGVIKPIDNMTILNGEVVYTNENQTVQSSIKVKGDKNYNGKISMDIIANRKNDKWIYKQINIRLKDSAKNKETIEIIPDI